MEEFDRVIIFRPPLKEKQDVGRPNPLPLMRSRTRAFEGEGLIFKRCSICQQLGHTHLNCLNRVLIEPSNSGVSNKGNVVGRIHKLKTMTIILRLTIERYNLLLSYLSNCFLY